MSKARIRRNTSSFMLAPWKEEERKLYGTKNYCGCGNYMRFVPNGKYKAVVQEEEEEQKKPADFLKEYLTKLVETIRDVRDSIRKAFQQPNLSFS